MGPVVGFTGTLPIEMRLGSVPVGDCEEPIALEETNLANEAYWLDEPPWTCVINEMDYTVNIEELNVFAYESNGYVTASVKGYVINDEGERENFDSDMGQPDRFVDGELSFYFYIDDLLTYTLWVETELQAVRD